MSWEKLFLHTVCLNVKKIMDFPRAALCNVLRCDWMKKGTGRLNKNKNFLVSDQTTFIHSSNNIYLCEINHNKYHFTFDIHINIMHYYLHRTGTRNHINLIPVLLVSDQTTNY
ncbi:hypothetical protein VPHK404_0014 [Vibrio phage K404]